jgi:formate dehydrogenase subunit gamma
MPTLRTKRTRVLFVLATLILLLLGGVIYLQAVAADQSNPHANFWRTVRQGVPGFTTVTSVGHKVLIENSGENWREVRNGLLLRFSQVVILLALLAMALFYAIVGKDRLEEPRSGVRIKRFTLGERILHWYTALVFTIMTITGLSILLGRLVLIPVFGHGLVSYYLQASKALHNYCGPLFLVGILLEIVVWIRYNIPTKADLQWFKNMGGMIGKGPRPHTGRVNGGEKAWFWVVFLFGIGVGVTGMVLDFPVWGQSRLTMQLCHMIHVTVAVLFIAASFGHVYVGTFGAEGVFEGMWTGYVDAVWARQHNDLWYEEVTRGRQREPETSS